MSLLKFFGMGKKSASIARERLQIVLSHQRLEGSSDEDFLPKLRNELIVVISKYVKIDAEQINVQLQRTGSCSTLELNITLPTPELIIS
jgi:cell division topological specificity factor